jgi:hypothetical protein
MLKMKHFDWTSILVIFITFILFATALFFTGLTHDILLETGVFLVSVKLIIMAYKDSVSHVAIEKELKEIKDTLRNMEEKYSGE